MVAPAARYALADGSHEIDEVGRVGKAKRAPHGLALSHSSESWRGLSRPSTPCLLRLDKEVMDARDERGHDDGMGPKKPSPVARARFTFTTGEWFYASARNLRLERRDLGLAAQRHRAHLAVPVDRHDDLGHAVALQQRDVADLGAAERVVEEGPLGLLGIVPGKPIGGPHIAPHIVVLIDRDVIGLI